MLLVEDDVDTAEAIVAEFAGDGVDVQVATSLEHAKWFLQSQSRVDVIIIESRLPDGRGETLLPHLERLPRQPAVVITSANFGELTEEALLGRPVAIAKPLNPTALLRIVKAVATGYAHHVTMQFVAHFRLSRRETETLMLLSQGLRAKEIAERMHCAEQTVYGHLHRICNKTGCREYHEILAQLFASACRTRGHTPPPLCQHE